MHAVVLTMMGWLKAASTSLSSSQQGRDCEADSHRVVEIEKALHFVDGVANGLSGTYIEGSLQDKRDGPCTKRTNK